MRSIARQIRCRSPETKRPRQAGVFRRAAGLCYTRTECSTNSKCQYHSDIPLVATCRFGLADLPLTLDRLALG